MQFFSLKSKPRTQILYIFGETPKCLWYFTLWFCMNKTLYGHSQFSNNIAGKTKNMFLKVLTVFIPDFFPKTNCVIWTLFWGFAQNILSIFYRLCTQERWGLNLMYTELGKNSTFSFWCGSADPLPELVDPDPT